MHVIKIIYGFFTLDFFHAEGLSYCIWPGAEALGIIVFKYVTVVYSLCLIVVVLAILRYCGSKCLGKYYRVTVMRNSVIQGLSAFLVMCYTQCVKTSFNLLTSGNLLARSGSRALHPSRVWLRGDIEFFSSQHLPVALPALAVLLTIGVIPPVILLTYPAIFHVFACLRISGSCEKRFRFLPSYSTMKPFLDAFQGSFKDRFRFFAGFYFIYRWVGVLSYAIFTQYSVFYAVVEIALVSMLLIHAVIQPYMNPWHNVLDALLLADLALINKITASHYYASRVDAGISYQNKINISSVFQVVLMYIPVIYLACYTLFHISKNFCCKRAKSVMIRAQHGLKKKGNGCAMSCEDYCQNQKI